MIIFKDYLSGGELCSDAIPAVSLAGGAVVAYESKKVKVGGEEINIGANASKEEAEEGVEDEVKTVINIVESHSLQQAKLEKKEYITFQNNYWRQLVANLNKRKGVILYGSEEKIPPTTTAEQKEEAKKLEAAATARVNRDPVAAKSLADIVARLESYKKNFTALQKFVKEEILPNFSEYDFYVTAMPVDGASSMIVPARYIGEALAPTFYFFVDGMYGEKL